jgi:hypothetical protein
VFVGVNSDYFMRAESARQNILQFAAFRLLRSDQTLADLFGDERVIGGQLFQRASAQQIGAAIADMSEAEALPFQPRGNDSSAHAALFEVALAGVIDAAVREMDGASEAIGARRKFGARFTVSGY